MRITNAVATPKQPTTPTGNSVLAAEIRERGCIADTSAAELECSMRPRDTRIKSDTTSPAEMTAAAYATT